MPRFFKKPEMTTRSGMGGIDEEDVDQEVDDLVDDPAGVGGEYAEHRRDACRQQSGGDSEQQ